MTNDTTPALIGADALREALIEAQVGLEFAAARLPAQVGDFVPSHLAALKIVNAALAGAAQPVAVPHAQMTEEIDNILSDPDTRLSPGAERALRWLRTWTDAPLAIAAIPGAAPVAQGDARAEQALFLAKEGA